MALKLEILLEAIDRISGPISRMRASLATLGRSAGIERLSAAFRQLGGGIASTAARIGGLGAGIAAAAYGFNRLFLRGAADMERFRIMLARTEGGAQSAERVLSRLREFADATPFDDAGVVESFIRLRDMNIADPFAALNSLGDAAAGRLGNITEAVEAFGAAMRGEFDPLEQYGIQTRIVGNNIVATWTTTTGRVMRLVADQNNRALVARGLLHALNTRYAGAMREQSRSWDGMVSNLRATWSRFTTQVMDAGVFNWLKSRLEGLLGLTGRMQRDGSMQTWAQATAAALIRTFEAMEQFVLGRERMVNADTASEMGGLAVIREGGLLAQIQQVGRSLQQVFGAAHDAMRLLFGDLHPVESALLALAGITFAPLIAAFVALGVALATNPMAAAGLAALTALAFAAEAIRRNWDGISDWFGRQMDGIAAALSRASDAIERFLGLQQRMPGSDAPRLQPGGGGRILQNLRPMSFGEPLGALGGITGGGGAASRLEGQIQVRVTDERVQVRGRSDTPGVRLDVDQGLLIQSV